MNWFIKRSSISKDNSPKENKYKVGSALEHKDTKIQGEIMNYYSNHYVVSLDRCVDNNFKKEVISLTEEEITDNFTVKGKAKDSE